MNTFSRTIRILPLIFAFWLNASVAHSQTPQNFTQVNGRCFADRFTGADGGAKINAALADKSCVIVDATNMTGAQTASSTITLSRNQQVVLGPSQWTLNGSPNIDLAGRAARILGSTYGQTRLINNTASGSSIRIGEAFQEVGDLDLEVAASVTRTGGGGLDFAVGSAGVSAHDLLINVGYYDIWIHNKGGGTFNNINFGNAAMNPKNIMSWIQGGPINSCCIASSQFSNLIGNGGSIPPSVAGIVLDAGIDTFEFQNIDFGHIGGTNFTSLIVKDSLNKALPPEWIRFTNSSFEGSGAGSAINIAGARSVVFTNVSAAVEGSDHAIIIDGPEIDGVTFNAGFALYGNKEVIYVPGANGSPLALNFSNLQIADGSMGSPGAYCDMYLGPNVSGVKLIANSFHTLGRVKASQRCSLEIAKGSGDHIKIIANTFDQGSPQAFLSGATGKDIALLGNSGAGIPATPGAGSLNTGTRNYTSKRGVAGCTTVASIGGICSTPVTVTWPTPFADTNYSVSCIPSGKPTNIPGIPYVSARTTGSVTINYFAITSAAASWAMIDCEAIHD